MPVLHPSASALSTAGVLTGHGPSSKVSTTSLSARKSNCLKCSKPKPGPPVVSTSTTRLTPSASGLLQGVSESAETIGAAAAAVAGVAGWAGRAAVVSGESAPEAPWAASFGDGGAATVAGAEAIWACGEAVQYQI